jgi:hypothetical protein
MAYFKKDVTGRSLTIKETFLWRRLKFDGFQVLDVVFGNELGTGIQLSGAKIKWCECSSKN